MRFFFSYFYLAVGVVMIVIQMCECTGNHYDIFNIQLQQFNATVSVSHNNINEPKDKRKRNIDIHSRAYQLAKQ